MSTEPPSRNLRRFPGRRWHSWLVRALLEYAEKLTSEPSGIDDADVAALATAGWDDAGIREITRLIAFCNFSGRLEAASGLPQDKPDDRGLDRFVGAVKSRGR